ncbi:MAG: hypothetical protein EPO26_03035 [Chloroflexota bacterium]|nr:MAG: hypothetical protein EPO26_03035 [Chloroflexota bacterium]
MPYQPDRSDEDDHDPWHARFPESLDDAYAKYLSEARGALILTANDGTRMPTELIRHRGSWRGHDDVECATMDYVDWFNHGRLHVALGMVPLAEYEAAHCHHVVPDNLAASQ